MAPGEVLSALLCREPTFLLPELAKRGHSWRGGFEMDGTTYKILGAGRRRHGGRRMTVEATDDLAERVKDALRLVIDPELGYNIVDLGLVYDVASRMAALSTSL